MVHRPTRVCQILASMRHERRLESAFFLARYFLFIDYKYRSPHRQGFGRDKARRKQKNRPGNVTFWAGWLDGNFLVLYKASAGQREATLASEAT